jgi:TatD DNase family protein
MSRQGFPEPPAALPVSTVDSHCHLDMGRGDDQLTVSEALARAAAVGVTRVVQIGCDVAGSRWAVQTAGEHPSVVATVALHPNEAPLLAERGALHTALDEIEVLAGQPRVRGIGETGLDHFRTGPSGRVAQEESFRRHIDLAKRLDKALVIHDRDAHDDVLRVLEDEGAPARVVFHCYSGDARMARHCVQQGWYLSFAGTVTFANAPHLRAAAAVTPLANLLVETDAPFLAPVPHRGRANASYLVPLTIEALAVAGGHSTADVCDATRTNALAAFGDWDEYVPTSEP